MAKEKKHNSAGRRDARGTGEESVGAEKRILKEDLSVAQLGGAERRVEGRTGGREQRRLIICQQLNPKVRRSLVTPTDASEEYAQGLYPL